ncbi:MAG: SWIM zinc finger domain-containing protein [Meiothermus sp.]|nr:SWIM zinc finger domain-containing protein [Meiothermus sp.]
MTPSWTSEQVLSLATDSSSAKSGRELSSPARWVWFARNEAAIWGECQGSGKLPYQTRVDLSDATSKCSCPSRKFPCKHALGLLWMYAAQPEVFKPANAPSWVAEWLEGRQKRAEAKAEKAAQPTEVDQAAQAKREAARAKKVAAGMAELNLWLRDLVRGGLAQAQTKPYRFWEDMAARLVDAQAPGLARRVRGLSEHTSGEGWQERLLEELGCIHLVTQGYAHLASLPEAHQADVRTAVGFTQSQEEVQAQAGVGGVWLVLGQAVVQEEKLRARRTWLRSEGSGQYALILEFAFGKTVFEAPLHSDGAWVGELAYFPSAYPMRAVLKEGRIDQSDGFYSIPESSAEQLLGAYSQALAANPWIERIPTTLTATLEPYGDPARWSLRSLEGLQFALHPRFNFHHALLGSSGGHPLHFFGEWDGETFLPLRAYAETEQSLFNFPHREGM